MSAFLFFAQDRRPELKERYPTVKNTDISRMLGEMWRNAPDKIRQPYIDREKSERDKYKLDLEEWRTEREAKLQRERKANSNSVPVVDQGYANIYMFPPDPYCQPYPSLPNPYGRPLPSPYGHRKSHGVKCFRQ